MGIFGKAIGRALGSAGGSALGRAIGGKKGAKIGSQLGAMGGDIAGSMVGFKTGGLVKGKKGKAVRAIVHGGEYVLPVGVKPTKAQRTKVNKLKRK